MIKFKRFYFIIYSVVFVFLNSCWTDKSKPNIQYMPDMYTAVPYEPYSINKFYSDTMASRKPADGTIKRGQMIPYLIPNTNEGYILSKSNRPSDTLVFDMEKAKWNYGIYCAACHGEKGDGQGHLSSTGKIPGVPNYKDRDITEGSVYHVVMYGKGIMGSHASQLTDYEMWEVSKYVIQLKNGNVK